MNLKDILEEFEIIYVSLEVDQIYGVGMAESKLRNNFF